MKFETGKTYMMRSVCNYDCVWTAEVVKRTAKTVTLLMDGETKNCRVREYEGVEEVMPLGRYSMAPVLKADRVA